MKKLFRKLLMGSKYVYFVENKHTHQWISKKEVPNKDGVPVCSLTINPNEAHQYPTRKSALSLIECGYREEWVLKCYWNKVSNFGNPEDFIVTEHEFVK